MQKCPIADMRRPSSFQPPRVPVFDCCIFYGSNFFFQLHEKDEAPGEPSEPKGLPKDLPIRPRKALLGASIDDMLLLVPQQRLLKWHEENITASKGHYAPLFRYISLLGGAPAAARFAVRLTEASGVPVLFNCRVPLTVGGDKV